MVSYIIDAAAAVIILIAFAAGMKKGLVKSVWRAAAWIITAVLVFALIQPVTGILKNTPVYEKTETAVHNALKVRITENTDEEKIGVPEFLLKNIDAESIKNSTGEALDKTVSELSANVTDVIIKIGAFVLLFIIIKIILAVIFHILNAASKLPVINGTNKLLGGLLGIINILFVIYIVCAVLTLFVTKEIVSDTINSTYLVKYFYNNNILLQLVFKR